VTDPEKPPVKLTDGDKNRFDMYHFISRWDFLLAVGVLLLFLIWLAGHLLHQKPGI